MDAAHETTRDTTDASAAGAAAFNQGPTSGQTSGQAPQPGGQEAAVKELREQVFPGRTIKSLQPAPDGSGKMAVVEW